MAEVKDGKGGKLFNQVLNFLHGGYVDHVFFLIFLEKNKPKPTQQFLP